MQAKGGLCHPREAKRELLLNQDSLFFYALLLLLLWLMSTGVWLFCKQPLEPSNPELHVQ